MPEAWTPRRVRVGVALLLVAAVVIGIVATVAPRRPGAPAVREVAPAPEAALYDRVYPDADGHPQALAQWKGRRLLLNFWATWCTPCIAEMPQLDRAQGAATARGAVIVALGTEDPAKVRGYRDKSGLHLPLLAGGYEALELARSLGDTQGVLPYTVLLAPDGRLLRAQSGPLRPGQLEEWLEAAP